MLGRLLKKGSRSVKDEETGERGEQDKDESNSLLNSETFICALERNPNTVTAELLGGGSRLNLGTETFALYPTDVEFSVPEHFKPGQSIPVQGPHGRFEVWLPEDAVPGKPFRYRLKAAPEYRVEVPPGAMGGACVTFERSDGARISIVVPPGLKSGDQFEVTPPALIVLAPEGAKPGDHVIFHAEVAGPNGAKMEQWFRALVPEALQLGKYFAARLPQPDPPQRPAAAQGGGRRSSARNIRAS